MIIDMGEEYAYYIEYNGVDYHVIRRATGEIIESLKKELQARTIVLLLDLVSQN